MEGRTFQMGNNNPLRPLIKTPAQVDYADTYGDAHKNKFFAIKWEDKMLIEVTCPPGLSVLP